MALKTGGQETKVNSNLRGARNISPNFDKCEGMKHFHISEKRGVRNIFDFIDWGYETFLILLIGGTKHL